MQRRSFIAALGAAVPGLGALNSWFPPRTTDEGTSKPGFRIWPSRPPKDCSLSPSSAIKGIGFTGRHASYGGADTWFPSWASDGNLYSPFTDGTVAGIQSNSTGPNATTGHAKIVGDDPLSLQVLPIGVQVASPAPYEGRYPSANLVHQGVWYYGTYCLDWHNPHLNYDIQGPFVGFRVSTDYGRSWTDPPCTPANPLFPETGKNGSKVKIGVCFAKATAR
jgi:hypothetical protein